MLTKDGFIIKSNKGSKNSYDIILINPNNFNEYMV